MRIARETAEGLAAAHAAGLIHRDVKPGNLWLEPTPYGPRVKVLDFGLARPVENEEHLTRTAALLGTPGYMAPEQARAEPVDGRADLFSLGCVLYRMLTGRPPFQGKTLSAVLLQVATHHPPPPRDLAPALPGPVSDLVMRLLSKDPADRPASARETADALRAVQQRPAPEPVVLPTTVDDVPAPERALAPAAAPIRRGRKTAIVAIVVGAVGVLLLAAALLPPPVRTWLFPGAREPDKPAPNGPPNDAPLAPHVPALWKGSIDLEINKEGNPAHRFLRLNDRDELPLKPGDMVAVQTNLDHAGYCYAVWIEADGTVDPVYPWNPGNWGGAAGGGATGAALSAAKRAGQLAHSGGGAGRHAYAAAAGARDALAAGRGPAGGTGRGGATRDAVAEAPGDGVVRERRADSA